MSNICSFILRHEFLSNCVCVLDCQWSQWSKIGECSKSCGIGTQILQRTVLVRAQNEGKLCEGESTKTENCNYHACEGKVYKTIKLINCVHMARKYY